MRLVSAGLVVVLAACAPSPPGGRVAGGQGGAGGGTPCLDVDGDGFAATACGGTDCNDLDPAVHPGAPEVCGDDADNDCDGDGETGCSCTPGDMRACWIGGEATRGVGACRDGAERCDVHGRWGPCTGAVTPEPDLGCDGVDQDCDRVAPACACPGTEEICGNGVDDDCNGVRDDPGFCAGSCLFPPGETPPRELACCEDPATSRFGYLCLEAPYLPPCAQRPCVDLDGDPATGCVARCAGDRCVCGAAGPDGEPVPAAGCGFETPCNRLGCELRRQQPCYTGSAATLGVGVCRAGRADCEEQDGVRAWGACEDEVLPGTELCANGLDDDCDGRIDEEDGATGRRCRVARACAEEELCGDGLDDDCDGFADEGCRAAERQSCWTGPPELRSIGACRDGTQIAEDGWWRPCGGEVLPSPEVCGDGVDADCNGLGGAFQAEDPGCCVASGEELCNALDDDCDGLVDEGVLSWCGTCGECEKTIAFDDPGSCAGPLIACERLRHDGGATIDLEAPVEPCDPGLLLFLDTGITRFEPATEELASWRVPEARVAMACDGSFWHATNSSLTHYDASGRALCTADNLTVTLTVDEEGSAWVVNRTGDSTGELRRYVDGPRGGCTRVDLAPDDPSTDGIPVPLGVAVMGPRDMLWIGSNPAHRLDTITLTSTTAVAAETNPSYARSVDRDGNLWFAWPLTRVSARGEAVRQWTGIRSLHVRAWERDVWFTDRDAVALARLDPVSGEVEGVTMPEGSTGWDPVVDTGGSVWEALYAPRALGRYDPPAGTWTSYPAVRVESAMYSDDSSRSAASLQEFRRHRGRWVQDVDGISRTSRFTRLRWDATVPEGASLRMTARFAHDRIRLRTAAACELHTSPADLTACPGAASRWMRIEARLVNGWDGAPVLRRVEVDRAWR